MSCLIEQILHLPERIPAILSSLSTISNILSRVISRPEEALFRTIRTSNEHYVSSIGNNSNSGATELLLRVIGFNLATEGSEAFSRVEAVRSAIKSVKKTLSAIGDSTEKELNSNISSSTTLPPPRVLYLEEPDVETDFDRWKRWLSKLEAVVRLCKALES